MEFTSYFVELSNMRGVLVSFWCCVLFFINIQFSLIPMHQLFVWTPLASLFYLVYTQKDESFAQVFWFLFMYAVIVATFSASFGLKYIFDWKRLFLP